MRPQELLTATVGAALGITLVAGLVGGVALSEDSHPSTKTVAVESDSTTTSSVSTTGSRARLAVDLPRADTAGRIDAAPIDLRSSSGGRAVHVVRDLTAYDAPDGSAMARVPARQFGSQTWLPVLAERDGWLKVRLPSRPNGSTGWVPGAGLPTARTTWAVRIDLAAGTLAVTRAGTSMGTWPVGYGAADTPTPAGETFLLGSFVDPGQAFSPVIYALGAHSESLDTFGGGPGTVAVHGWPTPAGRVGAVSHGCIRVPSDALAMFARLPAATPITITS